MKVARFWLFRIVSALCFCFFVIFTTGCSSTGWVPQWSGNGFIKKEFLDYKKVAVLPFKGDTKGEASDNFAQSFHERFHQITLVDRKQLLGIFQEQDLYSDRLNEATERKIGEDFGVQALIKGDVYYPSILRWLLQVQIIDVETGEVMGRSMVEIDFMGAEGVRQACRIAVQNLTVR
jgi:TolB-like protein